jgi:hypothetical protein
MLSGTINNFLNSSRAVSYPGIFIITKPGFLITNYFLLASIQYLIVTQKNLFLMAALVINSTNHF